jgi:membrane AbrB-like protein
MSGGIPGRKVAPFVVLRTLALGAAAGWVFSKIGVPLPWLTGPIALTAVLAISGVGVTIPDWFRPVIFLMLGVTIGSRVDEQMIADLTRWPASLVLLALYVPVAIVTMYAYFRLVARAEPNTALVSSTPGSLAFVLAYAADSGADMRKVIVTQSVRLGILVMLLPVAVTQVAPLPDATPVPVSDPIDQLWLFAAAAAGGSLAGWKLKIPAAPMLGALAVTAALHATGLNHAMMPDAAIVAAQVALGCLIGGRLEGANRTELARVSVVGLGAVLVGIALSALFALAIDLLLGIAFAQALLAFAPGAIEAMALMAVSLDLDPAYVGAHHIVRVMLMPVMIPLVGRWLVPRKGRGTIIDSE